MLKTGKSYIIKVLDHFSGPEDNKGDELFFKFVGRYVRSFKIYVVFEIDKNETIEGNFIAPLRRSDKYMYVMKGKFTARPKT